MVGGPRHEPDHRAIRINKTIGRTKTSSHNVIGAQLRKLPSNVISSHDLSIVQSRFYLLRMVRPQIREMLFVRRAKQISLWAISRWMPRSLLKTRIKRDRVERHFDVHRRRELRPHP